MSQQELTEFPCLTEEGFFSSDTKDETVQMIENVLFLRCLILKELLKS